MLASHHGLVTVPLLSELGVTRGQCEGWVARGVLESVERGVYGVPGPPAPPEQRLLAAVAREAADRRVRQLVDSARRSGALRRDRLLRRAAELPHHPGARRVLALAGDLDQESEGERRLRDVLGPLAPAFRWGAGDVVPGVRFDAYDDLAALALEFDGARHHSAERDITADRVRELRVRAAGVEVIRITWAMLRHDREATRRRIAAVRARRLGG